MKQGKFWCLEGVSDALLQEGLKGLLTQGARTEARIVAHLAEVDARKLHLTMGASSLFDYCLKRLGLSNNEAFHRITAARLGRRFPVIFELLERRDVHLTAVCLLRDYLTIENHTELLRAVSHTTKTEIEELLVQRFPKPNAPNRLRKLPSIEPRAEGRYLLQLNVSAGLKHKLELARDLMSHANPSGDFAAVVERALDGLIEKLQSRRFAQAKFHRSRCEVLESVLTQPAQLVRADRPSRAATAVRGEISAQPAGSSQVVTAGRIEEAVQHATKIRGEASAAASVAGAPQKLRRAHVRHDVRRAVAARDGQCCAFVSEDGHRCEARAFLQFHHERAWALGGADSMENLSLMCRAHTRLLAERELGTERVAQAIQSGRSQR